MGEQHLVILWRQAVDLLNELQAHTGGHQYLFPNLRRRQSCMSTTTLTILHNLANVALQTHRVLPQDGTDRLRHDRFAPNCPEPAHVKQERNALGIPSVRLIGAKGIT